MEGNINEERQDVPEEYLDDGETGEEVSGEISEEISEEQDFLDDEMQDYDEDNEQSSDGEELDVGGMEKSHLGGIYGLFKEVKDGKDTKRVSFLTNEELGTCEFNVRDCENISLIAETFGHPGVAKYFTNRSRIITDTALSKGGFFVNLFVTSKKYASRDSSSSIQNLPQNQQKSKWKLFSKKGNQAEINPPQ